MNYKKKSHYQFVWTSSHAFYDNMPPERWSTFIQFSPLPKKRSHKNESSTNGKSKLLKKKLFYNDPFLMKMFSFHE